MAAIQLSDIQNDLNFLLSDSGIPTSGVANQIQFINDVIADIFDRSDKWTWAAQPTQFNLSVPALGAASLASIGNFEGKLVDVREVISGAQNDNVYSKTDWYNITDTDPSQYYFGVSGNGVDGYKIYQNQTYAPTLTITPKYAPEKLANLTDTTRIPRSMVIAKGAFSYMQRTRNPFAELTDFLEDYEAELAKLIAADVTEQPKRQFYTNSEAVNRPIGQPKHV